MSYVDVLRDAIHESMVEGIKSLDWIDAHAPEIIRTALNQYFDTVMHLPFLGNALADQAIAKLHEAVAECRKDLEFVRDRIAWVGSPDNLRAAADGFGTRLAGPAGTLAGTVTLGKLRSTLDSNWSDGEASEAYEHAVDGRNDAVRAIVGWANGLATGLRTMADEIENYYLALLGTVIGLVTAIGGLVGSIVAIAGVVTTPAAVIGIVMAAVGVVGAGVGIYQLTISTEQTMRRVIAAVDTDIPAWPKVLS